MSNTTLRPFYQNVNGVLFSGMFPPSSIKEALNYKAKPDDIFIATYPKCGTTWMQNLALHIFRKGKELEDPMEFFKLCPYMDAMGNDGINNMPRPGAFKTHLPFTHVPYSPEAKYIYVLRNPKDCCVSLYYHTLSHPGYWEATFSDFFEIFMNGEVEYNDYFDHLDSWYPHLKDKNVFFTTYETLTTNRKDVILKLATFLGREYIETIEKDNTVLNNILQFTTFDYMKTRLTEVFELGRPINSKKPTHPYIPEWIKDVLKKERPPHVENVKFIRKGLIGDWKNLFSDEQSEKMNEKFLERTQGTEIQDMYKPFMY